MTNVSATTMDSNCQFALSVFPNFDEVITQPPPSVPSWEAILSLNCKKSFLLILVFITYLRS
jgi:hypothetical protein